MRIGQSVDHMLAGYRVSAVVGLAKLDGNRTAYWTATAEWRPAGARNPEQIGPLDLDTAGLLATVEPGVPWRTLFELHTCDWNGTPMHAVANARYWMGFTGRFTPVLAQQVCNLGHVHTVQTDREWTYDQPWPSGEANLVAHLRCTPDEARDARAYVDGAGRDDSAVMFALRRFEPTWRARALRAFGWLATTTIGVECGLHGVPL